MLHFRLNAGYHLIDYSFLFSFAFFISCAQSFSQLLFAAFAILLFSLLLFAICAPFSFGFQLLLLLFFEFFMPCILRQRRAT